MPLIALILALIDSHNNKTTLLNGLYQLRELPCREFCLQSNNSHIATIHLFL